MKMQSTHNRRSCAEKKYDEKYVLFELFLNLNVKKLI